MRGDILASGGRKATFGPSGHSSEPDYGELGRKIMEGTDQPDEPIQETPVIETPVKPKTIRKFNPLGDVILVRRDELEAKVYTDTALALKDTSKELVVVQDEVNKEVPSDGIVLAAGPGLPESPMTVAVGDHITFGKYSGAEYEMNGEKLLLMRIGEVLGTVTEEYLN